MGFKIIQGLRFEVGSRRHPRIVVLQHQIHGLISMLCECLCGNVKIGDSNFNYWKLDQNLHSFVKFNLRTELKYFMNLKTKD